jgi:NAD-dependent SIR2 family protein deacetylase
MARQTSKSSNAPENECEGAPCKDALPFDVPNHLLEQISSGNVVLFAGAGISTENKVHSVDLFYEVIAHELGLTDTTLPFDKLMSLFCSRPDGRIELIRKIADRFKYFTSFSDFYYDMTRFHHALSPLYMIKDIVTTNWDDFFERECDFDAFINDNDMPLWNASSRRLMKIHGSIRNIGSIVATEEDYRRSFRRLNNGPMGAKLKALLAEKTFIYVGYSISDSNYLRLARMIAKMTRPHLRQSYLVSPHVDEDRIAAFPIPLVPIQTDGAFFLEQVRLHLESKMGLLPEHGFELVKTCSTLSRSSISKPRTRFLILSTRY